MYVQKKTGVLLRGERSGGCDKSGDHFIRHSPASFSNARGRQPGIVCD